MPRYIPTEEARLKEWKNLFRMKNISSFQIITGNYPVWAIISPCWVSTSVLANFHWNSSSGEILIYQCTQKVMFYHISKEAVYMYIFIQGGTTGKRKWFYLKGRSGEDSVSRETWAGKFVKHSFAIGITAIPDAINLTTSDRGWDYNARYTTKGLIVSLKMKLRGRSNP